MEEEINQALLVGPDGGGAVRPVPADDAEPSIDFAAQKTVSAVNAAAQLFAESTGGEERNGDLPCLEDPTLPGDPNVEIEDSG